jgi:hypothetical protein
MSFKSTWSRIWKIVKPIVTLGLSLAIASIGKSDSVINAAVKTAGKELSDEVINEVDSLVGSDTETLKSDF